MSDPTVLQAFIAWLADRFPALSWQVVDDLDTARLALRPRSVEMGVAGRDAAVRLYSLASRFDFEAAAAYFYEVYELVCVSLAYALEGTW